MGSVDRLSYWGTNITVLPSSTHDILNVNGAGILKGFGFYTDSQGSYGYYHNVHIILDGITYVGDVYGDKLYQQMDNMNPSLSRRNYYYDVSTANTNYPIRWSGLCIHDTTNVYDIYTNTPQMTTNANSSRYAYSYGVNLNLSFSQSCIVRFKNSHTTYEQWLRQGHVSYVMEV
jgi:hypothetical protein